MKYTKTEVKLYGMLVFFIRVSRVNLCALCVCHFLLSIFLKNLYAFLHLTRLKIINLYALLHLTSLKLAFPHSPISTTIPWHKLESPQSFQRNLDIEISSYLNLHNFIFINRIKKHHQCIPKLMRIVDLACMKINLPQIIGGDDAFNCIFLLLDDELHLLILRI